MEYALSVLHTPPQADYLMIFSQFVNYRVLHLYADLSLLNLYAFRSHRKTVKRIRCLETLPSDSNKDHNPKSTFTKSQKVQST